MLKSKIIYSDDSEALEFVENYNRLNKKISIGTKDLGDYARVFYLNDKMVAGYCINTAFPIHYFKPVPEETWRSLSENEDFVETYQVWINNSAFKVTQMQKSWIYLVCIYDALKTGKKYIVGGSLVPKIRDQQMLVLSKPLHSGRLLIDRTMYDVWIYYNSRAMALVSLPGGIVKNSFRVLMKKARKFNVKVFD